MYLSCCWDRCSTDNHTWPLRNLIVNVGPLSLRRPFCAMLALMAALACAPLALAADYSLLGFGTLAYAVSDQKAAYLRYIDKQGTFKADSLIGLQGEVQFNPQWGATIQVVGSAPRSRDGGLEATIRWAFLSYRPSNDWLIRAGRIRPSVLVNMQNAEAGMTYDTLRLPAEVYSLSPVYDLDGLAFSRVWNQGDSETSIEGYAGSSQVAFRTPFVRNPEKGALQNQFVPQRVGFAGLTLAHQGNRFALRGGIHKATVTPDQQQLVESFDPVQLPGPFPIGGTLFVPGRPIRKFDVTVVTLGAEIRQSGWRVLTEYGHRAVKDTDLAIGSKSAYVSVIRDADTWSPYVAYARILSESVTRDLYRRIDAAPVPIGAQLAPLSLAAAYHKGLADNITVFDQYSWMIGTSWRMSSNSKLKFELMRTKVGLVSALVDGDVHHKSFNVLSMSYNFVF